MNRTLDAMYRRLTEEVDVGVHAVDERGISVLYNRKISEMENMDPEEVLGRAIQDVFTFEKGESTLYRVLETEVMSRGARQTYRNNKGMEITAVNDTFPVYENGVLVGALEISKDVTRLEKLVEENMRSSRRRFGFDDIIGTSRALREVIEHAKRAVRTTSSVLIIGETGTGKELFAQSMHSGSPRASGPFVSQNCAALPESLIEGILFGTKKGAFTGAENRPGLFEEADGGTLLLDELNSLSPALQSKLLRVIQDKSIRRVGDSEERSVDVRLVATMNEDPIDAIQAGRLRKDLYYRLSVVTLFIPPLRDRPEDLEPLLAHFLRKYQALFQLETPGFSEEALALMHGYHWPGNVREAEHVVEGALNLLQPGEMIQPEHLPPHVNGGKKRAEPEPDMQEETPVDEELKPFLAEQEKRYLQRLLRQHDYHVQKTATAAGLTRQSLQYRMKRLGIKKIRR
ncbi:sigma-54 interaction domain-containing protein [Alkalicoccus chagannorensis]|uniref:sigma-54 interaction domain-containing protein n=1 Tax=Alkalicoccus chagannorensis TaxID=427072 RepID=UPI00040132F1|nr:sigma 54-interacting transcriptional regulator [Alkalicoccus chagannorensis]